MPLRFLNSAGAIIEPITKIQFLSYSFCTFIHLTLEPNQFSGGRNYFFLSNCKTEYSVVPQDCVLRITRFYFIEAQDKLLKVH